MTHYQNLIRGHTRRKNGRKELKCFEKRRMSRRMRRRAAHLYKASSRRPSAKCIDNSAPTRAPWELLSDIFTWSTPSRHSKLYSKLFQNSTHRVTRLKNWCVDNVQNYYFFSIPFWKAQRLYCNVTAAAKAFNVNDAQTKWINATRKFCNEYNTNTANADFTYTSNRLRALI